MPNLRVDRQEAIRALAAKVRKQSEQYRADVAKHPKLLAAAKVTIAKRIESVIEGVMSAKTSEQLTKVLEEISGSYMFRKYIPATPSRRVCRHALMLKQLQMDARNIIPVSEKDELWTLLVDCCEN
jgi:hypothetical protein